MKIRTLGLLLAASAAALVGITFSVGVTDGQEQRSADTTMTAQDALAKITLTADVIEKSRMEPTAGITRAVFVHKVEDSMLRRNVEPKVVTRSLDGKTFAVGLQYTCNPVYINAFTVNGQPLTGRQFSYSVDTISWQAGDGWPVYTEYCPVNGYATNNYFPDAKTHQVVPLILGQNYFVGCASGGVCASNAPGQIAFAVNDTGVPNNNYYTDNRGYIHVTVWGILP